MIKKIFLVAICFTFAILLNAQETFISVQKLKVDLRRNFSLQTTKNTLKEKIATANINDTLHYFYNKHYYRNIANGSPTSPNTQFYTLFVPYTGAGIITHCGAVFLNSSSISIKGLEGIVFKNTNAVSQNVPVKLYLCNVNLSNLPIFPPLDSVLTSVPNTPNGGIWVGANFANPITVTGKFAVLFKNASTNPLDTIRLFINNASTPSSTVPIAQRYGEGLGLLRYNGNFQLTTNTFGTGSDYEFIVAPRISFSYTAGAASLSASICTNSNGSFTNTTGNVWIPSNVLENRQFNFNKFAAYWGMALTNTILPNTQPDSIYNWTFSGSNTGSLTTKNATAYFNANGIQTASLVVKYKVSANAGFYFSTNDLATATVLVTSALAPTISISGLTSICSGASTTLTANGSVNYTWTSPPSNLASIVVSPLLNTVYSVSSGNGSCIGTQTVLVSVITTPTLSITGPSYACIGASLILNASGANSYTWSTLATTPSISVNTASVGAYSYSVVGQNANCPSFGIFSQTITINDLPTLTLSIPNATLCSKATGGATVALTGFPSGGIYSGNISSTGIFNPLTTGTFAANYSYTNSATGCSNTISKILVVANCTDLTKVSYNQNLLVFPNPTLLGIIHLKNLDGTNTINVYSALGELIFSESIQLSDYTLDLTAQSVGSYYIKITDSNGQFKTIKIIN